MANVDSRKGRGTKRNDNWDGTNANDRFLALAGNDTCEGGGGNDFVDGGSGGDTIAGDAGDDALLGGAGDDDIDGGAGKDNINGGAGDDDISGGAGNDTVFGGDGNDQLSGNAGKDTVLGGLGDDNVNGGAGVDSLDGGDGNDVVVGETGNDRMFGGNGDDTLVWNDGDGNDIMSGNEGRDTIEVNGAIARADTFVLRTVTSKAFFERVAVDGQPVGQFNLTVDTSEVFDVNGLGGNDIFRVNDLTGTGVEEVQFDGGEGNDILDGRNTSTHLVAIGGNGDDTLIGGTGTVNVAPNTVLGDTLTGGTGKDSFQFFSDPFAGGVAGQNVVRPDVITDYELGIDQIVLGKAASGINALSFQKGNSGQLSGNSNLVVLTDGFQAAGQAAAAIANNPNFNGGRGVFVYFNTNLGFSRVVLSEDLGNNGRFTVLGNLTNLTNVANQANFSAADFNVG
ncbi:MAG: calcium-binding protein [Cyanobacteria bacterium CRU_2_1]|nr:calcium-binding protein [Cyanobacteria bacterium RU_5_0]NJR62788.1 calcium-binding protein [Cyanobacteria bacterium CRU_2_1]